MYVKCTWLFTAITGERDQKSLLVYIVKCWHGSCQLHRFNSRGMTRSRHPLHVQQSGVLHERRIVRTARLARAVLHWNGPLGQVYTSRGACTCLIEAWNATLRNSRRTFTESRVYMVRCGIISSVSVGNGFLNSKYRLSVLPRKVMFTWVPWWHIYLGIWTSPSCTCLSVHLDIL